MPTVAERMERTALELLASSTEPVGAIRLASVWRAQGVDRGEATAGRFLRGLDERELTTSAGATRGRVLTGKGEERLRQLREAARLAAHESALSEAFITPEVEELLDLLTVRKLVETECAALAARRATPDERSEIVRQASCHQALAGQADTTTPSMTFHRLVVEASHSRPLTAMARILLDPANDPLEKLLTTISHDVGDTAHQMGDHIGLAAAISRGDETAAREIMSAHVDRLLSAVQRYLHDHGQPLGE